MLSNRCTSRFKIRVAAAALLSMAHGVAAQSNINTVSKRAWSENAGWLNARDAGSTPSSQGLRVGYQILSGFVWSENIGWINMGDGSPASGTAYANLSGGDFGVNRNATTGALTGFAWSENAGWIQFSLPSLPANQQPRATAGVGPRLRGWAWSENVGWINLDSNVAFVGVNACPSDWNLSGSVSVQDIFDFLISYFAGTGDYNGVGGTTVQDIFDFLAAYFVGC